MPPAYSTALEHIRTNMCDAPLLLETISEADALVDLTSAIDICGGMDGSYDAHLLWLTEEPRKAMNRYGGFRFWKNDPRLQAELDFMLNGLQPDIVHTHQLDELTSVGHAARKAGVSCLVHTICGEFADAPRWQLDQFAAAVEGLSPILVVPNEKAAEKLGIDARIEIVPAGIDCERYEPGDTALARRKIGLPAAPRIIGCATPADKLETLFKALFRLGPEVHLALFGQAVPKAEDRALIKRLGLEERVHILGAWAKPELIYRAIDAYFHGPSGNCTPRPVLAAQACGKPVVACTSIPNSALCPRTGRMVPLDYMPALSNSLGAAIAGADAGVSRRFVLDNWNLAQTIDGYASLFGRFAPRRRPDTAIRRA